jgi:hypothetical protein
MEVSMARDIGVQAQDWRIAANVKEESATTSIPECMLRTDAKAQAY